MNENRKCENCEHSGIKFPYEKSGCYNCGDDHQNFSRKDRFEIRRGRFGCYFFDNEGKQEMDLKSVCILLNLPHGDIVLSDKWEERNGKIMKK